MDNEQIDFSGDNEMGYLKIEKMNTQREKPTE